MTYDIQIDEGKSPSMLMASADLTKGQFVGLDLQPAVAGADILGVCIRDSLANNPISLACIGTFYLDVEVGAAETVNVGDALELKDASTLIALNLGTSVAKAYEKIDNSAGGTSVVKKIPVKIIK
ncbi:MAG: DUF2190 family protein [Candidatus Cloacimonetes bacterium]|nr:DUF2190 family protein [Candidatus Cloacimonadota bacterium]MCF8012789.1 DUF2190 family protein [Candidatus Woesearchaeota archaeon]